MNLEALVQPGDLLRVPPHGYVARYALAIAVGKAPDPVEQLLDHVMAEVELAADPAPPPDSSPMVPVP